jgi:hypothetical protein
MDAVIVRPSRRSRQGRRGRSNGCAFSAIAPRSVHFLRRTAFRLCHKALPLM